jgi:hypothetical protein
MSEVRLKPSPVGTGEVPSGARRRGMPDAIGSEDAFLVSSPGGGGGPEGRWGRIRIMRAALVFASGLAPPSPLRGTPPSGGRNRNGGLDA